MNQGWDRKNPQGAISFPGLINVFHSLLMPTQPSERSEFIMLLKRELFILIWNVWRARGGAEVETLKTLEFLMRNGDPVCFPDLPLRPKYHPSFFSPQDAIFSPPPGCVFLPRENVRVVGICFPLASTEYTDQIILPYRWTWQGWQGQRLFYAVSILRYSAWRRILAETNGKSLRDRSRILKKWDEYAAFDSWVKSNVT